MGNKKNGWRKRERKIRREGKNWKKGQVHKLQKFVHHHRGKIEKKKILQKEFLLFNIFVVVVVVEVVVATKKCVFRKPEITTNRAQAIVKNLLDLQIFWNVVHIPGVSNRHFAGHNAASKPSTTCKMSKFLKLTIALYQFYTKMWPSVTYYGLCVPREAWEFETPFYNKIWLSWKLTTPVNCIWQNLCYNFSVILNVANATKRSSINYLTQLRKIFDPLPIVTFFYY